MYEREVASCRLCYRTFSCKGNLESHKNTVHTVPNVLDTREEEECEADPKEEDVDESDGKGFISVKIMRMSMMMKSMTPRMLKLLRGLVTKRPKTNTWTTSSVHTRQGEVVTET